jgi:hypothetical protein
MQYPAARASNTRLAFGSLGSLTSMELLKVLRALSRNAMAAGVAVEGVVIV